MSKHSILSVRHGPHRTLHSKLCEQYIFEHGALDARADVSIPQFALGDVLSFAHAVECPALRDAETCVACVGAMYVHATSQA